VADVADVTNTLVSLISSVIYPNGGGSPSAIGFDANIFPGWPDPSLLDANLNAIPSVSSVSVYPRPEEHNTTRFMDTWQEISRNTATLTLTAVGQNVTVGGTVPNPITSNPQNVVIFVNSVPYVYGVQQGDTTATIAAALCALIAAAVPGTSVAGAAITLPALARIGALRVGITGVAVEEIRRQQKLFQIAVWSATPLARDKIAAAIDVVLAGTFFLTLPDQSAARLIYVRNLESDALQKDRLYRRDLFYSVEYPTLDVETETEITQTVLEVSAEIASTPPAIPVVTIYS
jgi:hypothetical protein